MSRSSVVSRMAVFAAGVLMLGTAKVPAQDKRVVEQVHVLGSERVLWLITGVQDPGETRLVQWFSHLDKPGGSPRPVGTRPQVGRITHASLVGDAVHVFYADGVHYRYSKAGDRREIRLPEAAVPVAIAGDPIARNQVLWAVVSSMTADRVEAAWIERERKRTARTSARASAPTGEAPSLLMIEKTEATSRPAGSYHLVEYQGSYWRPGGAVPADFSANGRVWLAISGQRQLLIWQAGSQSNEIHSAWRTEGHWQQCDPLRLPAPPTAGFVTATGDQVVFAALVHQGAGTGSLRCWVWGMPTAMKEPDPLLWQALASPIAEGDQPLDIVAGSAITVFQENLAVARPSAEQAEVGLWSLADGKLVRPFTAVPTRQMESRPRSQRNLVDILLLAVLMGVFLLVFRRRHETLLRPITLPPEVVVAGFPRRLLAALIDMLPALILVTWLWHDSLEEFSEEFYSALGSYQQMQALVPPPALFWADLAFRGVYTVYCLVFELLWCATPGKRLMGCTVVAETMKPPSRLQILARNVTRLLELEPALIFFLAVMFLTPYRQRVGDLLARTIVIEGAPPEVVDDEDQDGPE